MKNLIVVILCIAFVAYTEGIASSSMQDLDSLEKRVNRLEKKVSNGNNSSGTVVVCILTPFSSRYIAVGRTMEKARNRVERKCNKGEKSTSSIFCDKKKAYCETDTL